MIRILLFTTSLNLLLFSFLGIKIFEGNTNNPISRQTVATPNIKYGINLNQYLVKEETVQKNESFAQIMMKHHVSEQTVNALMKQSKGKFNFHLIKAGNNYIVLGKKNKKSFTPTKIIYELNNIEYVVLNVDKQLSVITAKQQIEKKHREVAGVIRGSLYETFDNLDINPALAIRLSEIFACTIDFYKIHEGDKFKIIFDEERVNGESIGIGEISSALFNSNSKDYYAFYFEKDNKKGYYDEDGNSMRKQFLKSPVKFGRVSSRFSKRRFHPVTKIWKAHLGTDYAASHGTPIIATADGIVEEAKYGQFNGNYVKIRHNGKYKTQYLHMSRIGKGIRRGSRVSQGQTIGYVGSTGLATGPHVCYRFWKDGQQVDPRKQQLKYSEPIHSKYKSQFFSSIKDDKSKLDNMAYNADPEKFQQKKLIDKKYFAAATKIFERHF